jgi:uncharacterized protein YajQ (UPF0234 family)
MFKGRVAMSKDASFDVVSEFDHQELINALDQARREIQSRFDLKDSGSEVELEDNPARIVVLSTDDFRLQNILQIIEAKMIKRDLSPQIMDPGKVEEALGGKVRQAITLKQGIDKELAKKIVSAIKDTKLKVQASIQGDQVRVTGKNRDDLQEVIQLLRGQSDTWGVPLQFNNFR